MKGQHVSVNVSLYKIIIYNKYIEYIEYIEYKEKIHYIIKINKINKMKTYNGYGTDPLFFTPNYDNLYLLAQELQNRYYDYENAYSKEEREECTIPHLKERRPDVPEHRIQLLEYKIRFNYAYFVEIFIDFHKQKTKSYSATPIIELPDIQFPVIQNPNPNKNPNVKKKLFMYELNTLSDYGRFKVMALNELYDLLKDIDKKTLENTVEIPPLQPGASLEFVIITLIILASRLEYELQLEYNIDNTIKRIYFINYDYPKKYYGTTSYPKLQI